MRVQFDQITIFTLCMRTERPEQTFRPRSDAQNAASDQGLYCLPLSLQFRHVPRYDNGLVEILEVSNFREEGHQIYVRVNLL